MSYPYIIQGKNIVVVIGNKPYTVSSSHITYNRLLDAIKAGDWKTVEDLVDPKQVVLDYGMGFVSIKGETLYWKGAEMHNALSTRMVNMLRDGFDIGPLVRFTENLMRNPSKRAVDELYGFLEKNSLPITPDGYFLAYKKVRDNYLDVHSGTVLNKPASLLGPDDEQFLNCPEKTKGNVLVRLVARETEVSMERNQVDDRADNTCSSGLHFCSEEYLKSFGGDRVVILKINPADVVSIPSDYNNSKGRTCCYTVIGEVGVNPKDKEEFNRPVQSNANNATATKPVAPVRKAPKEGSSWFYRGYTDGYNGKFAFEGVGNSILTQRDNKDYQEGYAKGRSAERGGQPPKYMYVATYKNPSTWPRRSQF